MMQTYKIRLRFQGKTIEEGHNLCSAAVMQIAQDATERGLTFETAPEGQTEEIAVIPGRLGDSA